jgi:hypothetical protein
MNARIRTRFDWLAAAAAILACIALAPGPAVARDKPNPKSTVLTQIDFDDCDPFQVRAKVMEADPLADTFVVAEKEIRRIDIGSGEKALRTVHLDREGQAEPSGRYRAGEYVVVKGWLHPEGFVAASSIQRIAKPAEEKQTVSAEKKKLTKRERKLARRAARRAALP